MKQYREVFFENLRHFMVLRGKREQDIINDLHICSSTVSSWCTGKRMPRMDKILLLADYLGVGISDLIG